MTTFTYFEPLEAGHCTFWARMILSAAAGDPRVSRLRLVTSPQMAERLTKTVQETNLELEILPETQLELLRQDRLLSRGRAQWTAARTYLDGVGGQLFLPFFDHALFGAAVDRRPVFGQISGIVFRPPNGHNHPVTWSRKLDAGRRWGTYLAARRPAVRRMFTLDEVASQATISRAANLLSFLPDPAPNLSLLEDRAPRKRADGRETYLLFGSLGMRKGIFAILKALEYLPPARRAQVALRFVGRVLPADRDAFVKSLKRARTNYPETVIEWLDNFLSDEELAQEVVDCNVVLAPYQDHIGSSGVMFWAAAAGKPLLGQRTGLMGYQLEHYGLGLTVDTMNPRALAQALSSVTVQVPNIEFLSMHRPAVFTSMIIEGLLS